MLAESFGVANTATMKIAIQRFQRTQKLTALSRSHRDTLYMCRKYIVVQVSPFNSRGCRYMFLGFLRQSEGKGNLSFWCSGASSKVPDGVARQGDFQAGATSCFWFPPVVTGRITSWT